MLEIKTDQFLNTYSLKKNYIFINNISKKKKTLLPKTKNCTQKMALFYAFCKSILSSSSL